MRSHLDDSQREAPADGNTATLMVHNGCRIQVAESGSVIAVSGRLMAGHGAEPAVWAQVRTSTEGRDVAIELLGSCQLDAAGLGVLASLRHDVTARGHRLTVVADDSRLRRLLAVCGMPSEAPPDRRPSAPAGLSHSHVEGHGDFKPLRCLVAFCARSGWRPVLRPTPPTSGISGSTEYRSDRNECRASHDGGRSPVI